ncbi:single-stranded DNA-binding protein [Agriterribacter sp.]|uniref:single-stranded DNA-binding protein n=1 Tax=Agriterribacter sp. TaxID=2821509 RepID=UPI002C68C84E|nr:single-stranded DNA-binding protein [Agriterribacter sp.]HRO45884.1 single-stranded DNA-binding protein [Agriterribacter sp.]
MELTGRLTTDAKVSTLKDERKVVNFSIVINDRYKPKGGEVKEITTFINCAYWANAGIAPYLTKGTLVELYGRIGVNAWTNTEGEPKAALNFHVGNIKLHGGRKTNEQATQNTAADGPAEAAADYLPF